MYRYDEFDHAFLADRVRQFRGQVSRRLAGELSEEEFKPLRLMNGLYLQLHAYMLRVAIPYGTLSSAQLRRLAHVARRYDRGYGHFTTRQNIQYNWIKLEEAPDLMAELAEVEMHGIQTSGNCIRNVTADQYAGVAADEIEDARIWSEIIRQWSTLHPEFSFLPRKFKIAVTGAPTDRAAVKVHDIGLRLHRNGQGDIGFEVIVGGGLGRTPMVGKTVRAFLPRQDLLSYLEAIMRVYNRYGRRDNLYKSRIKILVHEIGVEKFSAEVEAEWQDMQYGVLKLPQSTIDAISSHFAPPVYEPAKGDDAALLGDRLGEPDFDLWVRANVAVHREPGYAIANISLKKPGAIPGDASADQMDGVADLADRYSLGEIRIAHEQNLVLPHVRKRDLYSLWKALVALDLAAANVKLVSDIIACPGLDYCSLANARSIPVAQRIARRFADLKQAHEIGELKLNISGCINACGHHHVGHIGLLGVDKNGEEFYQITLGGSGAEDASLGAILGPAVSSDNVVDAVENVIGTYLAKRAEGERFLDTYRRIGAKPFKERLYAAH